MLARPEGILIVTGPTGSGKTTTLYSLLAEINDETVNIMTLEDPVEYPLNLMRQTSVNEAIKMDFANGIRSIMRQDPDIILVGEVRDQETAEMAFRAAMTGTRCSPRCTPTRRWARFRGCSTSASSPTSWPATSSASSPSAWCACCVSTARRPTLPSAEERKLLGRGAATCAPVPPGRLQAVRQQGLQGAHGDHGNPGDGQRSRRTGGAARDRAELRTPR
jgi:energy-coupling factor transporter ATP-binding protein EcfA2